MMCLCVNYTYQRYVCVWTILINDLYVCELYLSMICLCVNYTYQWFVCVWTILINDLSVCELYLLMMCLCVNYTYQWCVCVWTILINDLSVCELYLSMICLCVNYTYQWFVCDCRAYHWIMDANPVGFPRMCIHLDCLSKWVKLFTRVADWSYVPLFWEGQIKCVVDGNIFSKRILTDALTMYTVFAVVLCAMWCFSCYTNKY